jgi:HEAT repeat protein
MDEYALTDDPDHQIVMHRDAHFSGSFAAMLGYYAQEGKGVNPEFEIERIEELMQMESALGENLASTLLSDEEREKVKQAKKLYMDLRDLYEQNLGSNIPRLIADLILCEEEEPTELISQLVAKGTTVSAPLIDLIRTDDFYDPLFPGYGLAPALAAKCLGLIKDPRAIKPLFEAMGKEGFFAEEEIIEALHQIGTPARDFLIQVITTLPITNDSERAAIALIRFEEDESAAQACLEMLKNEKSWKYPSFATYLVLGCAGLKRAEDREAFVSLMKNSNVSPDLLYEMKHIASSWSKH